MHLSYTHTHIPVKGVSSHMLPRQDVGPTLPNAVADKGEDQLPFQLKAVRGRGGHLSLASATSPQTREAVPAVPLSCLRAWLTHVPVSRVNSTVLPG